MGPTGADGLKGSDGSPGAPGVAGAPGSKGDLGATGDRGTDGEKGLQGDRGTDGEKGLQGEMGPKGDRGTDGSPGAPGIAGAPGVAGAMGPLGPQGLAGASGKEGPIGPPAQMSIPGSSTGDYLFWNTTNGWTVGSTAVRLGQNATVPSTSTNFDIAIGSQAQASDIGSIAMGRSSAAQGASAIALGPYTRSIHANAVVIASTGTSAAPVQSVAAGSFVVKPVRNLMSGSSTMKYDITSGEISYQTSSRRYKYDIQNVSAAATARVLDLQAVSFQSIFDPPNGPRYYGFIAEEVAKVDPMLVYTRHDEATGEEVIEGVHYDRVGPLLVQATRELKAKVDAQAQELDALTLRFQALESHVP